MKKEYQKEEDAPTPKEMAHVTGAYDDASAVLATLLMRYRGRREASH